MTATVVGTGVFTIIDVNDGARTVSIDMYQWSASAPTTFPTGTSTYTWATGAFTAPAVLNGWSVDMPTAVVGQTQWACRTTFSDNQSSLTSDIVWTATFARAVGAAGAQGPTVRITTNRAATFVSNDNTLATAQADIVFTATTSGITATSYAWTFYADSDILPVVLSGVTVNASSCTLTQTQFGNAATQVKSVKVVCIVNNGVAAYTDHITVVRLDNSTAAAGATVGATFLSTYTMPVGTAPTLTSTTGVAAMTYNAATGALSRSGGKSTVSTVNLNAGSSTTLLSVASNVITTTTAHGYTQANCVVYTHNGTTISGLVSSMCYYVIYISSTTFKLSLTPPSLVNGNGTVITLGTVTAGTTYIFNSVDYITATSAHGYSHGYSISYEYSLGGTPISGLSMSNSAVVQHYYVIYLTTTQFALATSAANAGILSGGCVSNISFGNITAGTTYTFAPSGWDASSYSTTSFTGGAQVSFKTIDISSNSNQYYMIGLSAIPNLSTGYTVIDYAIYIRFNEWYIYDNAVISTSLGVYTVGDVFSISYDGSNLVSYYKNGVCVYSTYVVTTITAPLYMDSSFYTYGMGCTALQFKAYTAPTLLSGNNLLGTIHPGNKSDLFKSNVVSTNNIVPYSVTSISTLTSGPWNTASLLYTYYGTAVMKLSSITTTAAAFSVTNFFINISNLMSSSTTAIPYLTFSLSKLSDIALDTYATYKQSNQPVSDKTSDGADWNVTGTQTTTFSGTAVSANVITTTAAATFLTGQPVLYTVDSGTILPDLEFMTDYVFYIIKLTSTTFKLALSYVNAMSAVPVPISITQTGTGTHRLTSTFQTNEKYRCNATTLMTFIPTASGVNVTTGVFTVSVSPNSAIFTGQELTYYNPTGTSDITPLVNNTRYFAIKVSATTLKLATSKANATAGTSITISAVSTSTTAFQFFSDYRWVLAVPGNQAGAIGQQQITASYNPSSATMMDTEKNMNASTDTYGLYCTVDIKSVTAPQPIMDFSSLFSIHVSKR